MEKTTLNHSNKGTKNLIKIVCKNYVKITNDLIKVDL